MLGQNYEVEIKSLLGDKEYADKLLEKMKKRDPNLKIISLHKQLNHYFVGGDLRKLTASVGCFMKKGDHAKFEDLAKRARDFSLRTRLADGRVVLVVKASVDDTTSANGTARVEFEAETPDLALEKLDELVLKAGFSYQAKWSRERSLYKFLFANVSIDKNAGYGYLAEFEVMENDPVKLEVTKARLRKLMDELGVGELNQERLERMFAYYNAHWPEYYGTDKVFVIE